MITPAAIEVRKGTVADRTDAVVAVFGKKTLDSANILVAEENGKIVGAACGLAPMAGDTAMLGQFVFPSGGVTMRANLETFKALLKAHVAEADGMGFKYGEAIVSDSRIVLFVERTFGVKAEEYGWEPNTGKAVQWRFVIVLADFRKVL